MSGILLGNEWRESWIRVSELLVCLGMQEKQRRFDQVGVCINKEVHDCFVFTYVMYISIWLYAL